MTQYLRGIAHGRGDEWEAFSLDFDLAVQGRSFEEVSKLLNEAVNMYVEAAMEKPEPVRGELLRRTAPLWVRLMWAWRVAVWTLRNKRTKKRTEEDAFEFPLPCPA
jgi:hypothetical protein